MLLKITSLHTHTHTHTQNPDFIALEFSKSVIRII